MVRFTPVAASRFDSVENLKLMYIAEISQPPKSPYHYLLSLASLASRTTPVTRRIARELAGALRLALQ